MRRAERDGRGERREMGEVGGGGKREMSEEREG